MRVRGIRLSPLLERRSPRRARAAAFLLGLSVALLAACGGAGSGSVLLITLAATRADALGAYGRDPSVTPSLDRLAAEGVVFEQAYTVAPLTLPAHASLLTGLVPPRHGVRADGIAPLPQAAETLAERARAAGFQTAAFLGSVVLDQGFGLEQGFERYEAPARPFFGEAAAQVQAERPAADVARLASEWLRARDRERPFFLWAHLGDAHAPYEPAPALAKRAGGDAYLGEVLACDLALGSLLEALREEKVYDDTLVLVVADHGEAFGEHGELQHGPYVWNTTLRVPLVLRLPGGARGGKRVRTIASVLDVFPTALAAMGLEPGREPLDGVSLLESSPAQSRGTYFESYHGHLEFGWHPLAGWVDDRGKSVHSASARFYEPVQDPGEERELSAERGEALARHRDAIAEVLGRSVLPRDAEGLDPELGRTLRALGYAAFSEEGVTVPAPLAVLALPDPHERAAELEQFQRAQGLLADAKLAEAESLFLRIADTNPANHAAWDGLAACLMRTGRHREALEPLERVLVATSGDADTWCHLGACRLVTGEPEKALAAFTHALELDPNHVQALGGLVHLMESAGMGEEAQPFREHFEAVRARP